MEVTPDLTPDEIKRAYEILDDKFKDKYPGKKVFMDESHLVDPVAHEQWKGMIRAVLLHDKQNCVCVDETPQHSPEYKQTRQDLIEIFNKPVQSGSK